MKKLLLCSFYLSGAVSSSLFAQDLKSNDVPEAVKTAFAKKYPDVKKVSWEKEKAITKPTGEENPEKTVLSVIPLRLNS